MENYEAPLAIIINFENDYVIAGWSPSVGIKSEEAVEIMNIDEIGVFH